MPNLGKVKRGPAEGVGNEWEAGSVVELMAENDLGSNRIFGDNEINPISGHQHTGCDENQDEAKIRFVQRSHG
jgi:hypothetical protein